MALDATAAGARMQAEIEDQVSRPNPRPPDDMAQRLAAIYADYSREATLPGADLSGGGNVVLLETAFRVTDPSAQVSNLAAGLCAYWATCAAPGIPAHGGTSVQSVTIPAAGREADMAAAILALVTDQERPGAFVEFYRATEAVVRSIPCVVVEIIPGSPPGPVPFPESIA